MKEENNLQFLCRSGIKKNMHANTDVIKEKRLRWISEEYKNIKLNKEIIISFCTSIKGNDDSR